LSLLVKETNATIRPIPIDAGRRIAKRLLWLTAFAFGLGVALPSLAQSPGNFSSLSATGTATLGGDVLMCSGRPWIDVRCNGAVGDGSHDDTTAINTTIATAITNDWPVHFSGGTYKISAPIPIDYAGQASHGFRLISEAAVIDGRSIAAGPVLQIQCGRGTPASPTGCFYFKEEGTLFVNASTSGYAVVFGNADFSDAHNSAKIDHLIVNNASTAPGAGGCQFNFVLDSDIYAVCVAAGGAAGLAFEQTQFSRISGAGTAEGTGGRSVVLENGYNFSNTFFALYMEVSPTCLSITFDHNGLNTFVSPFFNCVTAVNATASNGNVLLNPNYGGATVNFGPSSTGITVIGSGSRSPWYFPPVGNYTAVAIDDGINISSYNAPGVSMTVTLPALASLNPGWTMGFATDNGKGMTIVAPSGSILAGGRSLASVTLGAGNYEYLQLQADGNNFRIVSATRNTRLINGFDPPPWPSNWLYPATPGYAATLGDNGNILSSSDTASGLAVTLPATTTLPTGWSMGFATDDTKPLSIQVNATSGGHILWPGSGSSATTLALANTRQGAYEFLVLQYDGAGNFRIIDMTPATAQAIGTIGAGGITHWSFPSVSAYAATVADNGGVVSSYNSPLSFLAVTLPPTNAIPMGWTMAFATDNGKSAAVQVNGGAGEKILLPAGGGTSTNSISLATNQNYEYVALQFDGSNYRVVAATPQTLNLLGGLINAGSPASSSPCVTNQMMHDSNYLYICTAPNTWKRAAITGGY
jgi:Pectate lyase superfamily protein